MNIEDFSIEAQQKRIENNKLIEKSKKRLKNALKSGYDFKPIWISDKALIDFTVLGGEAIVKDLSLEDNEILWTTLDNLLEHMQSAYRNSYKKNKLWTAHIDDKITKALMFWEDGNRMIPPILIMNSELTEIIPHDGKHRIAICHYFDVSEIPVIIPSNEIEQFPKTFINKTRKN